jgi:AraC-like DNA-binding protein
MAKPGPPATIINWQQVDLLCQIQCTGEEISSVLGMHYDTLQRACKRDFKVTFAEYSEQKRNAGNASLRRAQWKAANAGNTAMLIWLGKQHLNQSDNLAQTAIQINQEKPTFIYQSIPLATDQPAD